MTTKEVCALIFVVGITLLFSSGCAAFFASDFYASCFEWKVVSDSRQYPKKPIFTVLPSEPSENGTLLDYSAVYYRITEDFSFSDLQCGNTNSPTISYNFMRFWPQGHVYIRVLDHLPSTLEADCFRLADMGFYEVNGTNIIIELYTPHWGYISSYGFIDANEINFFATVRRDGWRQWRYPQNSRYIKYPIGGMERQPDWTPTGMLANAESPGWGECKFHAQEGQ